LEQNAIHQRKGALLAYFVPVDFINFPDNVEFTSIKYFESRNAGRLGQYEFF